MGRPHKRPECVPRKESESRIGSTSSTRKREGSHARVWLSKTSMRGARPAEPTVDNVTCERRIRHNNRLDYTGYAQRVPPKNVTSLTKSLVCIDKVSWHTV